MQRRRFRNIRGFFFFGADESDTQQQTHSDSTVKISDLYVGGRRRKKHVGAGASPQEVTRVQLELT